MGIKVLIFSLIFVITPPLFAKTLVLEGNLPDQYVGTNNNSYVYGAVVVDQDSGLIEKIVTDETEINRLKESTEITFIELKRDNCRDRSCMDVIYPGMIDLHNHTKQNNLGVWEEAHGQFANRFEWRVWGNYIKTNRHNYNPWIKFGKAVTCSAFRWSEIQAMVVGTTYLQGPSSCVEDFAIHQVESSSAFPHSKKLNVQAPTDLVAHDEMVFVWKTLKPLIDSGKSYEEALARTINEYCFADKLLGRPYTAEDTLSKEGLSVLKNQKKLKEACVKKVPLEELPDKFIRYIYWTHKTVASKKLYARSIRNGDGASIIAHLSEGRADDEYNQLEYPLVKLLGMNMKGVHFVHGIGISSDDLEDMKEKGMGLIWSPFSNMLLYNQTLDIKTVIEKKVLLALGSDWLPTGSKGPLEELKIAYQYIEAQGLESAVTAMDGADSMDEALFKMVTENPAKMINHWQDGADNSEYQNGESKGGVGTIAPNAMASLIVTSKLDNTDPYKNIVRNVWEKDINLVMVDGKVQYGNVSYLQQAGIPETGYEKISENNEHGIGHVGSDKNAPVLLNRNSAPNKQEKKDFITELGIYIIGKASEGSLKAPITCNFEETKGFVHQNTIQNGQNEDLLQLFEETNRTVNLDRFRDIQRLIGTNMVTQSRNRNDPEQGDPKFVVTSFTPLYSCNDKAHLTRINDFISKTWPDDKKKRPEEFSTKPANMAKKYK